MGDASAAAVELLEGFLDQQARLAHSLLGDVVGVAITTAVVGRPLTAGASTAVAREVDAVQYAIGSGPCLQTLSDGEMRYVTDLGSDPRWPEYGPEAAARGAVSCFSVPVFLLADPDTPVAVVKAYAADAADLDADVQTTLGQFALQVSGGLGLAEALTAQAHELDGRAEAMNQRRVIDLAVGMLMERQQCDPDAAFALLRRYSQTYNVKVRDAATQLVGAEAALAAPFS